MGTSDTPPVRDFIEDWPYVSHYLQATLDPETIAHHGLAILMRSLNNGRLVCFVGSGVSMAYGRLGWGELVEAMNDEQAGRPSAGLRQARSMEDDLGRWLDALKLGDRASSGALQSGRYPAAFQFLERMNQLQRARKQAAGDPVPSLLRDDACIQLFDDGGHAYHLLRRLLEDRRWSPETDQDREKTLQQHAKDCVGLPPDADGLRRQLLEPEGVPGSLHDDATIAAARRHEQFRLRLGAGGLPFDDPHAWPARVQYVKALANLAFPGHQPHTHPGNLEIFLPPSLRFIVAALARVSDPLYAQLQKQPRGDDLTPLQRPQVVPPAYDPLLLLARRLRIARFITTNYDLDLERLLRDLGYAMRRDTKHGGPETVTLSRNALGAEARDGVFNSERAVDLIEFSLHGTDHAIDVMHLHGRVTEPESLLVTDEDYLTQYLRRGGHTDITEHALSLAFGASPLLFVGSGMNEDDILRPLRQFLTERRSRVDRQAVALLPADGPESKQIEETIALYSRYGVHTLHFGIGCTGGPGYSRVRWLAAFRSLLRTCSEIVEAYSGWLKSDHREADIEQARNAVVTAFRSLCRKKQDAHSRDDSLPQALWKPPTYETGSEVWPILRLPEVLDESLRPFDEEPLQPPFGDSLRGQKEMATLAAVLHAACDIALYFDDKLDATVEWFGCPRGAHQKQVRQHRLRLVKQFAPHDKRTRDRLGLEIAAFAELSRGLSGALAGLALCLKLASIDGRLQHWQSRRKRLPEPRPVLGPDDEVAPLPARGAPDGRRGQKHARTHVVSRHPLALRESPWSERPPDADRATGDSGNRARALFAPVSDRFFSDPPSQTFQALLISIFEVSKAEQPRRSRCGAPERRVIVLYADRGVGKGHFFEALRTERRLGEFIEWTWPRSAKPVRYAAFAFFNLSFSQEVVSGFDRINSLLAERCEEVFPGAALAPVRKDILSAVQGLYANRIALLRRLLELYHINGAKAQGRLLVAFSPFNLLFDDRGDPKNAELFRLVEAMFSEISAHAPIDWLLVCSGSPLPAPFRIADPLRRKLHHEQIDGWAKQMPRFALEHLKRPKISSKGQRRLDDTVTRLGARIAVEGPSVDREATLPRAWFHVLREAKTANTLTKYFPEVMVSLALQPGRISGRANLTGARSAATAECEVDARLVVDEISAQLIKESPGFQQASDMVAGVHEVVLNFVRERLVRKKLDPSNEDREHLDADCRHMFRTLQRSRYLVTLASAAAAELAWRDIPEDSAGDVLKDTPEKGAVLQAGVVVDWWLRLFSRLSTSQADDKPDQVVNHVLDHYHELHSNEHALPVAIRAREGRRAVVERSPRDVMVLEQAMPRLQGPMGWELMQQLLWHLAVTGHPVEADVLACAPAVRRACRPLLPPHDSDDGEKALILIVYILDVMVHRCLIFRLQPARVGQDGLALAPGESSNWRFTPHRFMQRTVFRKLHAPHVEHPLVDQFGLSMWATQPDDVPRPNRVEAMQAADLLAAWTGFPKDETHVMRPSAYHEALNRALGKSADCKTPSRSVQTLPARMLRAALGVVRTVYSVGVVSHFYDFAEGGAARAPVEGYFELHRLQVRWLIEQARGLVTLFASTGLKEAQAPFFAEEIVWLYNECGLYALVQGRLDSAGGLFGLALRAAEEIEGGDRRGALWCRIQLNLAVVDIERGRIREARNNLHAIYAVKDENPILRLLARGYLALVEHYSGNATLAAVWFDEVIDDLDTYGQSRSVAIFSRHLAELQRLRGMPGREEALRAADRAIAAATKGGHEDVRQLARLTRVRLAIDGLLTEESDSIQRRLEEIERYGVEMGMPRLIADTAYAKASHLRRLGETRHAAQIACQCIEVATPRNERLRSSRAQIACQCIEVATAHNLRLRQMTAIALLGRIYERRGLGEAGRQLVARAFELAESCDYSNMRASVRRRHA